MPHTLQELVGQSVRIVLGNVRTILPAREPSPRSLETDGVIDVIAVIKGSTEPTTFLVTQSGGTRAGLTVRPKQYSMIKAGEQYLLFLVPDDRVNMADVSLMPRYIPTGTWSGLFMVEGGKVRINGLTPGDFRNIYQDMEIEEMIRGVKTFVRP